MTDIKVPHEYLDTLRHIRSYSVMGVGERVEVLDALIAAAEADRPPLPEGEVVYRDDEGQRILLIHREGYLYVSRTASQAWAMVRHVDRDRLTLLRPTITEADVERAARAVRAAYLSRDTWDAASQDFRDDWMKIARAALDALGIEVSG